MIDEHRRKERKWCSQEIWWTVPSLHACRKRKSMKFLFYCMCIYWQQIQWLYFIFIFHFELGNIWSWERDWEIALHKKDRGMQNFLHLKLPRDLSQRPLPGKKAEEITSIIHWRSNWSQTGRFSKGVDTCLPCMIMCEMIASWDGAAKVVLKAWPVSLNRAAQPSHVYVPVLWSKITCAQHSSAVCHTLNLKTFSRKQWLRYHSLSFCR